MSDKLLPRTGPASTAALLALALFGTLVIFNGVLIAVALPVIQAELRASSIQMLGVASAFPFMFAVFVLIGERLVNHHNPQALLISGVAVFIAASLFCYLSPTGWYLFLSRALQGAGAGVMFVGGLAGLPPIKTSAELRRMKQVGVLVAAGLLVIGTFAGAAYLALGGAGAWRWIFTANLPIALLAMILGFTRGIGSAAEDHPASNGLQRGDVSSPRANYFAITSLLLFTAALGGLVLFIPILLTGEWGLNEIYAGGLLLPPVLTGFLVFTHTRGKATVSNAAAFFLIGSIVIASGFSGMAYGVSERAYWWGLVSAVLVISVGLALLPTFVAAPGDGSKQASGFSPARLAAILGFGFSLAPPGFGGLAELINRRAITASELPDFLKDLMLQSGYGERLTGGLYQLATIELQAVVINQATIAILWVCAFLALLSGLFGWFSCRRSA